MHSRSFLDLAGELRNQIYEEYAASMTLSMHKGRALDPPLSLTCRQVREELMSILHRCLFHTAPLEARVVDWNFGEVLTFLKRLKPHYNGQTRQLTIYIDVMVPAANYSPGRLQWCKNARFMMRWYHEDPSRQVKLLSDRSTPVRVRIEDQEFDVRHIVRFPDSSPFGISPRSARTDCYDRFHGYFVRRHGARAMALNFQLEIALEDGSSREWVRRYCEDSKKWSVRLKIAQENWDEASQSPFWCRSLNVA